MANSGDAWRVRAQALAVQLDHANERIASFQQVQDYETADDRQSRERILHRLNEGEELSAEDRGWLIGWLTPRGAVFGGGK